MIGDPLLLERSPGIVLPMGVDVRNLKYERCVRCLEPVREPRRLDWDYPFHQRCADRRVSNIELRWAARAGSGPGRRFARKVRRLDRGGLIIKVSLP